MPGSPRRLSWAMPAWAERLADNLVTNAIVHNIPGGWIEIATGMSGSSAILSVANTGPAIPPAEVQRLFEPFKRLGADRIGGHNGVGLGLSIAKAIAGAHDAHLSAHALPGGGLEIQARFPEIHPGLPGRKTLTAGAQTESARSGAASTKSRRNPPQSARNRALSAPSVLGLPQFIPALPEWPFGSMSRAPILPISGCLFVIGNLSPWCHRGDGRNCCTRPPRPGGGFDFEAGSA